MILKLIIIILLFASGVLCLLKCVRCRERIRFNENRFREKRRGVVTDYRKKRHSLAQAKRDKVLYHPVIKFKKDDKVFEGVIETGYNREYYKVGNKVVVYYDILNPSRIKTKGERGDRVDSVLYFVVGVMLLIFSVITVVAAI